MKAPRIAQLGLSHAFEVAVAVAWSLTGFAWLAFDGVAVHSPIARDLGPWHYVWGLLYCVAAPLIIVGIVSKAYVNVRMAGLILLSTGLTVQFCAAMTAPFDPRSLTYLVWAVACLGKVYLLWLVYFRHKAVAL